MNRVAGVVFLLIGLYIALFLSDQNARETSNLIDLANRQGFYAVLTIGVGILMVAGGIDLSMGSVVALGAVLFGVFMERGIPPYPAAGLVCVVGMGIGIVYGLLVTRLGLQAFLVTLCGLFVYRGIARFLTNDGEVGLQRVLRGDPRRGTPPRPEFQESINSLRYYLVGQNPDGEVVFPGMLVVALILAALFGTMLHFTVYGRYWYAIGYNEKAARFSGVAVNRHRMTGFVISSFCSALAGVMLLLSYSTAKPDNAGNTDELYAITGAVLGGVSLRGGEGTIFGIVLGAAVLPVLRNLVTFLEIENAIVPAIIGLTLLAGVIVDEKFRRRHSK
ncbi:MAG: ABC transporter permease [Pirellula sp.]|jgi:ribose transport system permease protein|nr:ABC transporter permease [Pirellula sp.]